MTTAHDEFQQMCAALDYLCGRIHALEAGIEREAARHERMAEEAGMCERDHEAHVASRNAARLRALLGK